MSELDLHADGPIRQSLHDLHRKVDHLMADITALTNAVNALDTDEQAAAADLQALTADIASLQVGQVTQAQIDALTNHATAVATALSAATAANQPVAPPAPSPAPGPSPTPGPAPIPATRSVYTVDAGTPVDTTQWTTTNEQTTDTPPKALYNYTGDTAPGDHKGDGLGGVWHLYTGPVTSPPAPAGP